MIEVWNVFIQIEVWNVFVSKLLENVLPEEAAAVNNNSRRLGNVHALEKNNSRHKVTM